MEAVLQILDFIFLTCSMILSRVAGQQQEATAPGRPCDHEDKLVVYVYYATDVSGYRILRSASHCVYKTPICISCFWWEEEEEGDDKCSLTV